MTTIRDPHLPVLHRIHPRGWINDPNGIVRTADGRWHVFFQYNPASTRHEHIRWGHMSSPDLVTWREEPMGPSPRPGEADADGCWSGVGLRDRAADPAGTPTLVYSGVDGADNQLARVLLTRLDADGTRQVEPVQVVADVPPIEGLIGVRDPFVFEHGGRRWAIQGAGVREGDDFVPTLPLYSCDDLERWELVGSLLRGDHPVAVEHATADLWECPQLVPLEGRWVLLLSRWRHPDRAEVSTVQVDYLVGDLVDGADGTPRFEPTRGGRVDFGPDFYAPQAVLDADGGRVLCWGWSWEGAERSQEQTDAQGWAGALTFPRELRLVGDRLLAAPATELVALRSERLPLDGEHGAQRQLDLPAPARAEIRTVGPVRIEVVGPDGGVTEAAEVPGPATAYLDGSLLETLPEEDAPRTVRLYPEAGGVVRVRGALREAWALAVP